jgi:hypothetical protein
MDEEALRLFMGQEAAAGRGCVPEQTWHFLRPAGAWLSFGSKEELIEALLFGAWDPTRYGPFLGLGESFKVEVSSLGPRGDVVESILRERLGVAALRKAREGLPAVVGEHLSYRHARTLYRALRRGGAVLSVEAVLEGGDPGARHPKQAAQGQRTLVLRAL